MTTRRRDNLSFAHHAEVAGLSSKRVGRNHDRAESRQIAPDRADSRQIAKR
jgi:hypothetical protein